MVGDAELLVEVDELIVVEVEGTMLLELDLHQSATCNVSWADLNSRKRRLADCGSERR